jgi:hypothetical protein
VIRQAYTSLEPDGYLELQDLILPSAEGCQNGPVKDFLQYIGEGSRELHKDVRSVEKYKEAMKGVGFVDVTTSFSTWPTSDLIEDFNTVARTIQERKLDPILTTEETITAAEGALIDEIPELQM